jgi:tRNA threonylcarbamoyladenosine biosynthesis protein TsaE
MAIELVTLNSLKDTKKLARKIAGKLRGGDVLALRGKLGAGKTTFTQFLSQSLGVKQDVKSPTFNIMHLHKIAGSKKKLRLLCHVDCYRLRSAQELEAIGLFDHLADPETITVIEWAEKIKTVLPPQTIWINFTYDASKHQAKIRFPN